MILMRGAPTAAARRAPWWPSAVLVVAFVALNCSPSTSGTRPAADSTLRHPPRAARGRGAGRGRRLRGRLTVPGTVVTAAVGCALFGLPLAHLWVLAAVIPLAGAALAGLGAALGLLAPRPELATLLGQLGMSAALLLGVLPPERMPEAVRVARPAALDVRRRGLRADLRPAPQTAASSATSPCAAWSA
ncbi:ABC-2 type transport system permease protein OS=Streptomyces albaduncus OX=68172 GN=FHS32_003441 PE=4 SV=1 [Streptomyces griseoloalbus]